MPLIPRGASRRRRGWWIAGTVTAVLLTTAVVLTAITFPSVAATTCPGCYGLERLQPGVYAEPRLAPAERRHVAEVVEQANKRVRDFFGGRASTPDILVCLSDDCYRRIGGGRERGIAVLNRDLKVWVAAAAPYDPLPACLVGGCGRDRRGSGICDLHTRRLKADGLEVADAAWLDKQPLFDDAARLLLTLLYQRQVCSMKVLADLLEVTDTCIADLVKETRRVLEDHGHHAGTAQVRFTKPAALLDFLDTDQRPARTAIIDRLSHPILTGISRDDLLGERASAQLKSWHSLHELRCRMHKAGRPCKTIAALENYELSTNGTIPALTRQTRVIRIVPPMSD
jgi:hypothetical protein